MDESENNITFSASDTKLFVAIITHLTAAKIDTDWDKVATTAGYKDAGSAQARFRKIRHDKLGISLDRGIGKTKENNVGEPQAKLGKGTKSRKGRSGVNGKHKRGWSETSSPDDEEGASMTMEPAKRVKIEDFEEERPLSMTC